MTIATMTTKYNNNNDNSKNNFKNNIINNNILTLSNLFLRTEKCPMESTNVIRYI